MNLNVTFMEQIDASWVKFEASKLRPLALQLNPSRARLSSSGQSHSPKVFWHAHQITIGSLGASNSRSDRCRRRWPPEASQSAGLGRAGC